MFKKINRLPAGKKISGKVLNTKEYILKFEKNSLSFSRFAFVVSKKVDKRAVVRNSLKRKLRSCLEESVKRIKPGFDMLYLLKKDAIGIDQNELCSEVNKELKKQNLCL